MDRNPLVAFSFGRHQMSKQVDTVQNSRWSDLWGLLQQSRIELEPWQKGAWVDGCGNHWVRREDAPTDRRVWFEGRTWIAPFLLNPKAADRKIRSIHKMSNFAALDIDHGVSETALQAALMGYAAIAWSTANSTSLAPRWRVLVLLSRSYRVEDHLALWMYFNDVFDGRLDPATKDATRLCGMPATWRGGNNRILQLDGEPASVDMIMEEYGGRSYVRLDYEPAPELVGDDPPSDAWAIVEPLAVKHFVNRIPGGRFWKLLLAIAGHFHTHGWCLRDQQLCDAALLAAGKYAPEAIRDDALREARRAIGFMIVQPRKHETAQQKEYRWMMTWKPTI